VLVDALIRDVRSRQSIVRSILEDAGEANRLPFINSARLGAPANQLVGSITSALRCTGLEYQAAQDPDEGFALLRAAAERSGVFVLLIGNLGSHHTAIDVESFRGFALADEVAPFVVINDQDARTAWAFTLIHELGHLWLGATGISGAYAETQLEQYCNEVASEFLFPRGQLAELAVGRDTPFSDVLERIRDFSASRNLSATMVAYRLHTSGAISRNMWEELRKFFLEHWRANRDRARADAREQEGGPNYYVVRRHRVGEALIALARRSMSDGLLTPTRAGRLLGVRAVNVHELIGEES
jgi:Zn-dependent peptidase ImmA (M78 family)